MVVKRMDNYAYLVVFDDTEVEFIKREAKEYNISIEQMFETIFGLLFTGGYSILTGKDG